MSKVLLLSAPYMLINPEPYRMLLGRFDIELIIPEVNERLEAAQLLQYAGQFDGEHCCNDRGRRVNDRVTDEDRNEELARMVEELNDPEVCRSPALFHSLQDGRREGKECNFAPSTECRCQNEEQEQCGR